VGGVCGADVFVATAFGFGGVGGQDPLLSAAARTPVLTTINKATSRVHIDTAYYYRFF
jgi:hypothetical protein